MAGLALAGLLFCGSARAQIAIHDGSTSLATSANVASVSKSFTVTPGASVLVVSLLDRNNVAGNVSPAILTWTAPGHGAQALIRAISVNNTTSTFADSDIYYLFNPEPGTTNITATDTSGTIPSAMVMQAYTLSGVDTNSFPVTYTTNNGSTTSVAVTLSSSTQASDWAVLSSSYGTANLLMNIAASSGTVTDAETNAGIASVLGYVADLSAGSSTITANAGAGAGNQKMALGVAVFGPSPGAATPPIPSAPTNVVATPGNLRTTLSWLDSSGGLATSYIVLRSTTSGTGYGPIVTNTGNASTSFTDTSGISATTYFYVVEAVDAAGTSSLSAQVSSIPLPPPTAPINLAATAQTNRVALSWSDTSGGFSTTYIVLRSITSGSNYIAVATLSGIGSTNYIDTSVYDGTTYFYVVEAVDSGGTSSPSTQASAIPFFALLTGLSGNIALLDGGTNSITTVASGAGSNISSSFAVSQGASVMVVELWDRNQQSNNSSPSTITWSNATTGTIQTLVRAISQASGTSTFSDCDIFYLFNPAPGSGTISGSDTNGTSLVQGLTMMPVTLAGVDTTVAPVTYSTTSASATTLSVTTSAKTPAGAWAAALSFDGNSGQAITQTSTSGSSTTHNVLNNQEQSFGFVSGLGAGATTIGMSDAGGATKCTLAAAVFMPAIGTGIALLDGSLNTTATVGAVSNIVQPFAVSQGASVLVVAVQDNDNSGPAGYPGANLVWSNATFGTIQPISVGIATNSGQFTWIWTTLYYVMDPLPGTGFIIGTDTNSSHNNMFMQAYTFRGVDTTVIPTGLGIGQDGTTLFLDTPSDTVVGSAAALMSINYNGGGGNNVTFTSTSGQTASINPRPGGNQCAMGYVTNLAAGDSTISAVATGGSTHMDEAAEIFSPLIVLTAPINVTATGQTNRINLTWADSSGGGASGYIVLRSTTSGTGFTVIATNTGNASTTYTDTSVTDWNPYFYVVQAVGSGGTSVFSAQASAVAMGPPTVVTGLTATADVNQVDLSWNNQLGATSFNVLRSTTSGSGFTEIGSSDTNSFIDTSVTDGTRYYYEVSTVNGFGTSANSGQVSAVPVVAFLTNYIGVFNTDSDTNGWSVLNGTPQIYAYPDAPPSGPSSECLIMDAIFGPGGTGSSQGIQKIFGQNLNVSTYKSLEMDIKNQAGWDEFGQVQAIQLSLQLPVGGNPSYQRGTWPDIVLFQAGTGGEWTHYIAPLTNWGAFNLADLTALGIPVFDGNTLVATEMYLSYANIAFTGAPAWAPAFFGLSSPTIASGSTSVTLSGKVSATVDSAPVFLASNTVVSVTINGSTQTTTVNDAMGDFSISFDTTGFATGTYPIAYSAAGDMVALVGATDGSTSLTLTTGIIAPPAPTILPPGIDSLGKNLVVNVATVSGFNYYLLTTTNLAPPVVWATNSITAGTGGTITNLVPISVSKSGLFLRYFVQ
ncbi:MAG TPA: hypothetical protein VH413_15010 [Verrucomicrobiae bacterium]|nr:hypothetical protein [Verrucomicrobiae bacterium]